MKILVIVKSKHRQNTLKIAEAMAEVAPITICDIEDSTHYNLDQYDIIGLGSGINAGKFSKELFSFVTTHLNELQNVFVFSTSGKGKKEYNNELVDYLNLHCKNVLGSFACKGLCKWFIFAIIGGISKGHPDMADFDAAQAFIEQVMDKYKSTNN